MCRGREFYVFSYPLRLLAKQFFIDDEEFIEQRLELRDLPRLCSPSPGERRCRQLTLISTR